MIQHSPEPNKPKAAKLPFLAFAKSDSELATLRAFTESHGWGSAGILQGDISTAAEFLKNNPSPEILLVEIGNAAGAQDQLDQLADVCDPHAKVIIIGDVNEYSFYCWLMEIGISSYLLKPLTKDALDTAYAKATEKPAAKAESAKQPGKVVAVLGTRGGVGATTVAINLAGILAQKTASQVGLVDLDPQEGSVALMLDLEPSRGMRDVLEKPDRIDSLFIERVMQKTTKHLSILSAEEALTESIPIHDQAAELLLKELRIKFDLIVIDVPRYLNGFSRACIRQAEQLVLVTELNLLSLRDALRLSDLLRDQFKMKPPMVVANRVGLAAKQELLVADFEKGLNQKVAVKVPFAPELYMNVGAEIPAVAQPTHVAVKPLYDLVTTMFPDMQDAPQAEKAGKPSLLNLLKSKKD